MNPASLVQAFVDAGFDTPEKVKSMLQMVAAQTKRTALMLARDALNKEMATLVAEIEAKRQQLTTEIEAETAKIIS